VLSVVTFGALPLVLSFVQYPWPGFRTWDSSLPFQIANEATLDRPWLGRIHLVALYNRALSREEIANNFQLGFSADGMNNRAKKGLVALYTFRERSGNIVRDVSGFGVPLDLLIAPTSHVNWLSSSNGIEIAQPAVIKSKGPASKLALAFRGSDEISVEAWFTPANLRQKGPARIVSYSEGLRRHNFTVGQQDAEMVFWLRTLISGRSSGAQALETDNRVLKLEPSHIFATYAAGVERIYINGVQHPNTLEVTKDVVLGFATGRTQMAQTAYSFFYFFPVALFLAIYCTERGKEVTGSLLTAFVVAAGLQSTTEISQSLLFNRAIDFSLIGYGLIIAILGSLVGTGFFTRQLHAASETSCLSGR
jgi:hypothetical protein